MSGPSSLAPVLRYFALSRVVRCTRLGYDSLVAMDKIAELIDAARQLSRDERRRLIGELDALDRREPSGAIRDREPFAALLAMSATVHSDFADLSTNKYAHVAAAAVDSEN